MTHRLILIRHAKSSWDDPFGDDHERVLNTRGQASAKAVGAWMMAQGYVPDAIVSSDAARAQETTERVMAELEPEPKLRLSGRLYHAAPDTIMDLIQSETAQTLAVVGHNPGIGMLANMLVQKPPKHARFSDYPTCGTTVINFAIESWRDLRPNMGECGAFVVPRDLIGTASYDIE